jgi:tetratricopeptide (TPR) repeat protein
MKSAAIINPGNDKLNRRFVRYYTKYAFPDNMKPHLRLTTLLFIALIFPPQCYSQDLQKILEQGISYLDSGKYEDSRHTIYEYLKYDSLSASAWNCVGLTFLLQEDFDSAIYYFHAALNADPDYPDATFNLGRAHSGLGSYHEALVYFRHYAASNPDTSAVWAEIAGIYEQQGVYDSALYFINTAIEKNPDDLDAIDQRMFINMILENYEFCEKDARHILSIIPQDLTAIYCLAFSLMEKGDYDESLSHIQQGIELAPKLAAFYSLMSRVLTRKRSFVESGMFINRAIDLSPQEPGNYLIKAENDILSVTIPSLLIADSWPPRFRTIKSPEISNLDKYISDRKNIYYHMKLEDVFLNNFRSLGLDQFFMLYYGQTISEIYLPYAANSRDIADSIHSLIKAEHYSEAGNLGAEWLENNLPAISIYWLTGVAFLEAGNKLKAEEFFYKYEGFITSILATGDGEGYESAYIVISTTEEYTLMEYLGFKVSGQFLSEHNGHYFDILTGIAPSGEEKQVYFNIDKPLGSIGKILR